MNNPSLPTGRRVRPVRVLYVATYYVDDYVRQTVILRHLRELPDVNVETIIVNHRGGWRYASLLWRFLRHPKNVDVVYLGWRGIEIMPFLKLATRRPIILDAFVSIYETLCLERRRWSPTGLVGRFVRWHESCALRLAAGIVTDTKADAEYFSEQYSVPEKKFTVVPVGVDTAIYQPQPTPKKANGPTTVLFYGTYLPLHGVDVIVDAARQLQSSPYIRFIMIGDGPTRATAESLAHRHGLKNIEWRNRISQAELAKEISAADICLGGPFSDLPKAQRVVTGKTFQFLAMGKPTIVSDTPGNREFLVPGEDCLAVPVNDPAALAHGLNVLAHDHELRQRFAPAAQRRSKNIDHHIAGELQKMLRLLMTEIER